MKGKSSDSNQPSFLLPSLKEQLDPNHPIYQLNERINWSVIEEDFKKLYSRAQVVLRSRSGWWFRFCSWNNLKISVMSKLSDDGLIFLTGSIYRERHTFSGNLLQLPQTWPISAKGSAKKARNVYWSCRSISSIQSYKRKKWSLIPSRKKTSPIPPIPNWPKKSLTSAGTLRNRKGFP